MTSEELARYINLSSTFPFFLQELGLDPAHPLIAQLFDETTHNVNVHTEDERAIFMAWVVWHQEYKADKTTIWYSRHINDTVNAIMSFKMPEGHKGDPPAYKAYRNSIEYEAGSVLFVKSPHSGMRGLTIHNLIIEDVNPSSETYERLCEARFAVMGRFVTIW